ncbi:hypothetical protein MMC21_007456 [Puttea exsequens]|nr:hypothetical protein [Puttea exsequens]
MHIAPQLLPTNAIRDYSNWQFSNPALFTSISSAITTLCPTTATTCDQDTKITIPNIVYIGFDDLETDGELTVQMSDSGSYDDSSILHTLIGMAAQSIASSATGGNCADATYETLNMRKRDHPYHVPETINICNAGHFASPQYYSQYWREASSPGPQDYLSVQISFGTGPGGDFDCAFVKDLMELIEAYFTPELLGPEQRLDEAIVHPPIQTIPPSTLTMSPSSLPASPPTTPRIVLTATLFPTTLSLLHASPTSAPLILHLRARLTSSPGPVTLLLPGSLLSPTLQSFHSSYFALTALTTGASPPQNKIHGLLGPLITITDPATELLTLYPDVPSAEIAIKIGIHASQRYQERKGEEAETLLPYLAVAATPLAGLVGGGRV